MPRNQNRESNQHHYIYLREKSLVQSITDAAELILVGILK